MDYLYWVITRDCNQHCGHCYNDSKPGAPGLTKEEVTACVKNLPGSSDFPLHRIGLSGGEVYVNPELLFHTLGELQRKYGKSTLLTIQTNGDLLTPELLERTMSYGVTKFHVSSQDKYHLPVSVENKPKLEELFESKGFKVQPYDGVARPSTPEAKEVFFWGATEDLWIGPLWPRGRAMKNGLSKATTKDDFCGGHFSGAKNFLNVHEKGNMIPLQLADVYPCCAMTCRPLGDLRQESLKSILDRHRVSPVFAALNEGKPEKMGESMGFSEAYGRERSEALGNHCLWCDEFFTKHAPDLLHKGAITERGTVDLLIQGKRLARKAAEKSAAALM